MGCCLQHKLEVDFINNWFYPSCENISNILLGALMILKCIAKLCKLLATALYDWHQDLQSIHVPRYHQSVIWPLTLWPKIHITTYSGYINGTFSQKVKLVHLFSCVPNHIVPKFSIVLGLCSLTFWPKIQPHLASYKKHSICSIFLRLFVLGLITRNEQTDELTDEARIEPPTGRVCHTNVLFVTFYLLLFVSLHYKCNSIRMFTATA